MFDIIISTDGGSLSNDLVESLLVHTDSKRVRITTVGRSPCEGKNLSWVECRDPRKAKRINLAIECTHHNHIVLLNSQCKLLPQPGSFWLDLLYHSVCANDSHAAAGPLKLHHIGTDYIDFFCVIIPRKVWFIVGPLEEDAPFQEAVVSWFERAKKCGLIPKAVTESGYSGSFHVGQFPIYYSGKEEQDFNESTHPKPEGLLFKKERNPSRDISVPVVAHISTKDRHSTTLPLAIQAISLQEVVPCQLLIFDDNCGEHPFYLETIYEHLFNVLSSRGCEVQILIGGGSGQVANHQKAIDMATVDLLWRVDDDNSPEPNVLKHLYHTIQSDPNIGAVASLVHFPWIRAEPVDVRSSGAIADVKTKQNIQWFTFQGLREVQHLHNTFLFKKSAAHHGYPKNLSTVGHREETMFTAQMALDGWKLIVVGDAITWHLRDPQGGIRSFQDASLWQHDEQIFSQWAFTRGIQFNDYWLVVLDNGLGDHWAFKHVLPDIMAKASATEKILLLAVCYPDVFEDIQGLNLISIHDAKRLAGDQFEKYSVYNFMIQHCWTGTLVDAFKAMHGV